MKILTKLVLLAVLIMASLALSACGKTEPVSEVSLGDGLPTFEVAEENYKTVYPTDYDDPGLEIAYTTENNAVPDVWLYSFEKAEGQTLESFGNDIAARYKVFCNMISYEDVPCANITYYRNVGDTDCIIRSYVFEAEAEFKAICLLYKTTEAQLAETNKTIDLMSCYSEKETDSIFPYEKVYEYADDYLPTIRVREFGKDYFSAETYDASLMPNTTEEEYSSWAEDGWTLEEAIEFYDDNYELLKGEIIQRNGLDAAFIGYIDEGVFYVRAVIDCGDEYVMLCAENDAALFQHVVNALIDTIADAA